MADDEGIVSFALRLDGVANHFSGAAEFDDRVGVIVVRRYPSDVDGRPGIDNGREVLPEPLPVVLAVRLVDEALIPNADRVQDRLQVRGQDARYRLMLATLAPPQT